MFKKKNFIVFSCPRPKYRLAYDAAEKSYARAHLAPFGKSALARAPAPRPQLLGPHRFEMKHPSQTPLALVNARITAGTKANTAAGQNR